MGQSMVYIEAGKDKKDIKKNKAKRTVFQDYMERPDEDDVTDGFLNEIEAESEESADIEENDIFSGMQDEADDDQASIHTAAKDSTGTPESLSLYYSEIKNTGHTKILNASEEQELAHRIQNGDKEALDSLVMSNLRLVISIAKRYQHLGMPLEDLVQDGNVGLMTAAARFDPDKGCKFSTYATWWIRQSIVRSLCNTGRTIRLPNHIHEKIIRMKRAIRDHVAEYGKEPNEQELAKALDMSLENLRFLIMSMQDTVSADKPVGDDDDTELSEFIPDNKSKSVEQEYEKTDLSVQIGRAMDTLTDRESSVIIRRFGLDGNAQMTLEEIGAQDGVSRERIRQIEAKAMRKLRSPLRLRFLRDYA